MIGFAVLRVKKSNMPPKGPSLKVKITFKITNYWQSREIVCAREFYKNTRVIVRGQGRLKLLSNYVTSLVTAGESTKEYSKCDYSRINLPPKKKKSLVKVVFKDWQKDVIVFIIKRKTPPGTRCMDAAGRRCRVPFIMDKDIRGGLYRQKKQIQNNHAVSYVSRVYFRFVGFIFFLV